MSKQKANKLKVYVAMSGGVDSSIAAALLKKHGHDVTGVFFKPWSAPKNLSYCNWQEDRQDALRVCAKLGIPFKTWDFSREYEKSVTQYMIDSYRAGITPNPDVMCNKEIKFGLFLKRALNEGADYIATGHYSKIQNSKFKIQNGKTKLRNSDIALNDDRRLMQSYKLITAKDKNKDQSYFLYTLTQNQLKHILLPIGNYTKPEVRQLAKKFGLPNHAKHDSQGVCFVGELNFKDFLKYYIQPKPGEVRLLGSDKTIGHHDGVYYYTIGQRHGLNLGIAGGPYFVAKKDLKKNIIHVVAEKDRSKLGSRKIELQKVNWINGNASTSELQNIQIKIRYRTLAIPAKATLLLKNRLAIRFKKPALAVTPGQAAVIYKGTTVLGGGTIV